MYISLLRAFYIEIIQTLPSHVTFYSPRANLPTTS